MTEKDSIEQVDPTNSDGSQLTRKFFIAFAWTLVLFIILITSSAPKEKWVVGLIGSGLFALISGLIAMALPTKLKIIFVPTSLLVVYIIASIIGRIG